MEVLCLCEGEAESVMEGGTGLNEVATMESAEMLERVVITTN